MGASARIMANQTQARHVESSTQVGVSVFAQTSRLIDAAAGFVQPDIQPGLAADLARTQLCGG